MNELRVIRLTAAEARFFGAMTFPAYRHLLQLDAAPRHCDGADQRPIQPLALAALSGSRPLGMILAELPLDDAAPEILSLFVTSDCRGQGVATALVAALEAHLSELGAGSLAAVYMSGKPAIPALERVLAKRAFEPPRVRMVTIRFDAQRLNEAAWMHRRQPLRGYEIFSWMDLRESEREQLQQSHAQAAWIAPDLLPWEHDRHGFEPITSIGLRYRGEVVGWVINHRLDEVTVRFTCSFVRADLARLGRIVPLYQEALARMLRFGLKHATFVTPMHHEPMARFALKWFAPWSSFVGETRGTRKLLDRAA